jgi:hypothetical protein
LGSCVLDWNGDSALDVLTPAAAPNEFAKWYRNRSDESFDPAVGVAGMSIHGRIACGDLQGDGVLDAGVSNEAGGWQLWSDEPAAPAIPDRLSIDDFSVALAGPSSSFAVRASHGARMDGFTVAIEYDPLQLQLERISTLGSAAAALGVELEIPQLQASAGIAIVAVIFDFVPPYAGQFLPAASDDVLLTGEVRAAATAVAGVTAFGPVDRLGQPPADNLFVAAGATVSPQLVGASVTLAGSGAPLPPPAATFVRGDANDSGGVDIADGTFIQAYLYSTGPAPACLDAADVNDDGLINTADPVFLFAFLTAGGPPPPAPYPSTGPDPTPDVWTVCN